MRGNRTAHVCCNPSAWDAGVGLQVPPSWGCVVRYYIKNKKEREERQRTKRKGDKGDYPGICL